MLTELSKNLHIAKVIDNNSTEKNGRVKIYIPYMHEGIKNDFLPEALPFTQFVGGSSDHGISLIPENDSYVWVFFEDEKLQMNPFYIGNVNTDTTNPNTLFEDNIKDEVGMEGIYPNVKFLYTKNGICLAINTTPNEAEIVIYHPKAYIYIDKNGYTYYKDMYDNRIKIDETGLRIKDTKNNEIKSVESKLVINGNLEISQ